MTKTERIKAQFEIELMCQQGASEQYQRMNPELYELMTCMLERGIDGLLIQDALNKAEIRNWLFDKVGDICTSIANGSEEAERQLPLLIVCSMLSLAAGLKACVQLLANADMLDISNLK